MRTDTIGRQEICKLFMIYTLRIFCTIKNETKLFMLWFGYFYENLKKIAFQSVAIHLYLYPGNQTSSL